MNRIIPNKIKTWLARGAASALIVCAAALAISGLMAQPPGKATPTPPPAPWPTGIPHKSAMDAFSAALTKAGWDEEFRKRLKESPAAARAAVAEIGNINIPDDKFIMFYEPQQKAQATSASAPPESCAMKRDARGIFRTPDGAKTWTIFFADGKSSEDHHIFALPPFNKDDQTKKYSYNSGYLMCCYREWWE